MHSRTNCIHRDIKPANFRVHLDKLYLSDFGLTTEWNKDDKHIP
jgi:serine/threonine protein kinase